jgi:transglutaminase-like putative cysteine protease
MNRRAFLRATGVASATLAVPSLPTAFAQQPAAPVPDGWRVYEVNTRVEILKPAGVTRVWLPTPLLVDAPYIKNLSNTYQAEGGSAGMGADPKYAAGIVWAEWEANKAPVLTMTSRFSTRDAAVDLSRPGMAAQEDPAVLVKYTLATDLMPTDGVVKELSSSIVRSAGARTDIEKARALYEWIVENTVRDPKTRGCGTGDVKFMVENKAYSGKCADLNALYVALARAEGLPARDVYGVRVADSALGYKSLGKSGDITKAQHCRAEVHLRGYGWVPVDPADVRKVILEEGGGKDPKDPMVLAARKRLFGSWEMNWLAYNYAHDVSLPHAQKGKIGFFMYPQCETGGVRLDPLDPDNFKYQMSAKQVA